MSPSSLSMDEPRWRGVLPVPKCGWVLVWEASLQFEVPQSTMRTCVKRQRVAALCDVRTQKAMISVPDLIKCAVAVEGTLTT